MGSQQSHEHGALFVQTEKPFYIAGDQVNGNVFLNLWGQFPGNVVHLKIKGIEESWWRESRTRTISSTDSNGNPTSRQETYYEDYNGKNVFYCHRINLYSWQTAYMNIGQFQFPFQFLLSNNLPGTFFDTSNDHKGKIKYKLKAEITPISGGHGKKIKHSQELVIREPIKELINSQQGEMHAHAKTWCCLDKGICHIKCYFDRNCYMPGESAQILCEIDNSQCQLNIERIDCKLVCHLRLESNHGHSKVHTDTVTQNSLQGLLAGQTAQNENRRFTNLILQRTQGSKQGPIQPSTHGRYVNCTYILQVTAVLEGCTCCSQQPVVEVPITIVSPPPVNFGQMQAPQNWSPQIYQVNTISFNSQDMYTKSVQGQISSNQININMNMNMNEQPGMMQQQVNFAFQQQQQPFQ